MSHPVRPVTVHAVIPADPATVLDFVADTRNDPTWCPNVETVELLDGDGVSPGSVFRYHQHLDTGRSRAQFDGEARVLERGPSSVRWQVSDKFQERDITISVRSHPRGTLVQQVTQASFHRAPGLLRWVYPLMARRELRRQFARLADHFG